MKPTRQPVAILALFLTLAGAAYATCFWCGSSGYGSCPDEYRIILNFPVGQGK